MESFSILGPAMGLFVFLAGSARVLLAPGHFPRMSLLAKVCVRVVAVAVADSTLQDSEPEKEVSELLLFLRSCTLLHL
jgi:hypothetical protein